MNCRNLNSHVDMHTNTASTLHNPVTLTFDLLTTGSMHATCVPSLVLIAQVISILECGHTDAQTDAQSHRMINIGLPTHRLPPSSIMNVRIQWRAAEPLLILTQCFVHYLARTQMASESISRFVTVHFLNRQTETQTHTQPDRWARRQVSKISAYARWQRATRW